MSQPNSALVELLRSSKVAEDDGEPLRQALENAIPMIAAEIQGDLISIRRIRFKNASTTAAMLAWSSRFRRLAMEKGVDLNKFDEIVGQMTSHWKDAIQPQNAGIGNKLHKVLRNCEINYESPDQPVF
jgi:hypothetical protein